MSGSGGSAGTGTSSLSARALCRSARGRLVFDNRIYAYPQNTGSGELEFELGAELSD
jgi:hypothetical protein